MREKLAYISDLHDAVVFVAEYIPDKNPKKAISGWQAWTNEHSEDEYYEQIHARLLVLMSYYKQSTIDAVCIYMYSENKIPAPQSVPSALFWPYKLSARFSDSRGVIQKRVPASILRPKSAALLGAPGSRRWGTYEIFLKCVDCLWKQPYTSWWDDPLKGPMGRDKWYLAAESSGLFWLNYFNQQTLDWMYGPGKPNVWPFEFRTPPWCVPQHYYWNLGAYDYHGYASLNIVYFPPPGSSYGSGITTYMRLVPDDSLGNPGNMEVGYLYSSHASMNTDYEVNGEYSYHTVSPLPSIWTPLDLSCVQHEDDPWLYQVLDFMEMSGDYYIYLFVSNDLNFNEPDDIYYEELGGEWY